MQPMILAGLKFALYSVIAEILASPVSMDPLPDPAPLRTGRDTFASSGSRLRPV